MWMQTALALVYPHHCATCDTPVDTRGGMCGPCWRATPFIEGLCCAACGAPLPGEDDATVQCDDCLTHPRPWDRGRSAMVYADRARRLVLQIKHGDRMDLIPSVAVWMARTARPLLSERTILVPVPSHWTRLVARRYNQAAALAGAVARLTGHDHAPQALVRGRRTGIMDGKGVAQRFANLDGAVRPHPRHARRLRDRPVLLVDDVMTSGATLSAATLACRAAGAATIDVLTLARAVRDP